MTSDSLINCKGGEYIRIYLDSTGQRVEASVAVTDDKPQISYLYGIGDIGICMGNDS